MSPSPVFATPPLLSLTLPRFCTTVTPATCPRNPFSLRLLLLTTLHTYRTGRVSLSPVFTPLLPPLAPRWYITSHRLRDPEPRLHYAPYPRSLTCSVRTPAHLPYQQSVPETRFTSPPLFSTSPFSGPARLPFPKSPRFHASCWASLSSSQHVTVCHSDPRLSASPFLPLTILWSCAILGHHHTYARRMPPHALVSHRRHDPEPRPQFASPPSLSPFLSLHTKPHQPRAPGPRSDTPLPFSGTCGQLSEISQGGQHMRTCPLPPSPFFGFAPVSGTATATPAHAFEKRPRKHGQSLRRLPPEHQ